VVRLLVTHLRTVKNEEVIISNSTILRSEIINYSSLARERGLILHTWWASDTTFLAAGRWQCCSKPHSLQ
jgi:hypothetical protein